GDWIQVARRRRARGIYRRQGPQRAASSRRGEGIGIRNSSHPRNLPARNAGVGANRFRISTRKNQHDDPIRGVSNETPRQGVLLSCRRPQGGGSEIHFYHLQQGLCLEARSVSRCGLYLLSETAMGIAV